MASYVMGYKGRIIKRTTKRDNTTYEYWVIDPKWSTTESVWEDETIEHCKDWIDSDPREA